MRNYVRIKFKSKGNRIAWAIKLAHRGGLLYYRKVDKQGSHLNELIVLMPDDVVWERPARMNLHYGELELVSTVSTLD